MWRPGGWVGVRWQHKKKGKRAGVHPKGKVLCPLRKARAFGGILPNVKEKGGGR